MRFSFHLLSICILLIFTSAKSINAQEEKCELCLYMGQYYSPGAVIIQETVVNGNGFNSYPFKCKTGQWVRISSNYSNKPNVIGTDKYHTELIAKATACEICIYGNLGFSNGSLLCLPDNDFPVGKLKPYKCNNGNWILFNSEPCEN